MAILTDFKKLLPSNLENISRWQEFIDSYQDLIEDFKDEKIDKIVTQFDSSLMDKTDFSYLSNMFGKTIYTYEGYTNTLSYFKKETLTLVLRILKKVSRIAYKLLFYVFNTYGDVFPLYKNAGGTELIPLYNWWTYTENDSPINILDSGDDNLAYYQSYKLDSDITQLDQGQTLDTFYAVYENIAETEFESTTLDATDLTELDQNSFVDLIVRDILINYILKQVESSSYFHSTNTLRAFYNDAQEIKRLTELLYFEPVLEINYNTDHTLRTTSYSSFDDTETGYQKTLLLQGEVANVTSVQIGSGIITNIDGSITHVNGLVETWGSGEFTYSSSPTPPYVRKNLSDKVKMPSADITEAAFLDSSGVILYSTFPAIKYYSKMYSGLKFNFYSY